MSTVHRRRSGGNPTTPSTTAHDHAVRLQPRADRYGTEQRSTACPDTASPPGTFPAIPARPHRGFHRASCTWCAGCTWMGLRGRTHHVRSPAAAGHGSHLGVVLQIRGAVSQTQTDHIVLWDGFDAQTDGVTEAGLQVGEQGALAPRFRRLRDPDGSVPTLHVSLWDELPRWSRADHLQLTEAVRALLLAPTTV